MVVKSKHKIAVQKIKWFAAYCFLFGFDLYDALASLFLVCCVLHQLGNGS